MITTRFKNLIYNYTNEKGGYSKNNYERFKENVNKDFERYEQYTFEELKNKYSKKYNEKDDINDYFDFMEGDFDFKKLISGIYYEKLYSIRIKLETIKNIILDGYCLSEKFDLYDTLYSYYLKYKDYNFVKNNLYINEYIKNYNDKLEHVNDLAMKNIVNGRLKSMEYPYLDDLVFWYKYILKKYKEEIMIDIEIKTNENNIKDKYGFKLNYDEKKIINIYSGNINNINFKEHEKYFIIDKEHIMNMIKSINPQTQVVLLERKEDENYKICVHFLIK